MKPNDLNVQDIKVGDSAVFERAFSQADVLEFARLSGDSNPLHTDPAYAQTTKFGKPLVHGLLVGSLCSAFVGMYIPGKRCLYLSQTLDFKKPVFIGDTLKVAGEVKQISVSTGIVVIALSISKDGDEVVKGLATVQVL